MVGIRCRRVLTAHDQNGTVYGLRELVRLIDATTAFSEVRPDIVEGGLSWLETDSGLSVSPDESAGDGSLTIVSTGVRIWPDA
jgi:hypothetical protein